VRMPALNTIAALSIVMLAALIAGLIWAFRATRRMLDKYAVHIKKTMGIPEVKRFLEHEPRASVTVLEDPEAGRVKILWLDSHGRVGVSVTLDAATLEVLGVSER